MAKDVEDLVLSLSADTRQILRAMKKLEGDTAKTAQQIEQKMSNAREGAD